MVVKITELFRYTHGWWGTRVSKFILQLSTTDPWTKGFSWIGLIGMLQYLGT